MKEQNHEVILTTKMDANSIPNDVLEIVCKKLLKEILNCYGQSIMENSG